MAETTSPSSSDEWLFFTHERIIGNIHGNLLLQSTHMRPILFLILISLVLVACGTKGPLYIPERQYPQSQESK